MSEIHTHLSSDDEVIALDRRHVWHPFTQAQTAPDPIEIVSGKGAVLTDAEGREYLDLIASWWVNIHGHAHPHIAAAIAEQAARLEQVIFAGFTHRPAVELASALAERLPEDLDRVFFSDDGSTAVEVALKMATQYWINKGTPRRRFIAFEGGYHGDTAGAMSVGSASGFFDAFQNMMFSIDALPYPETWDGDSEVEEKEAAVLHALDAYLSEHASDTAALIIEPLVQGAGGMRMCRPQFLRQLAARLKQDGVLLIFDEVMTGFGRTGKLFACHSADVTPDIICLSKGLSGGFLPISVTVCRERLYQEFLGETFARALAHGHSFTANPIACAAANASLEVFELDNTFDKLAAIETLHRQRLQAIAGMPGVNHCRVTGTIAAFDLVVEDAGYTSAVGQKLKAYFHDKGLLIRPLGNVVYLIPPYCTSEQQLHYAYDEIEQALRMVTG